MTSSLSFFFLRFDSFFEKQIRETKEKNSKIKKKKKKNSSFRIHNYYRHHQHIHYRQHLRISLRALCDLAQPSCRKNAQRKEDGGRGGGGGGGEGREAHLYSSVDCRVSAVVVQLV